MIFSTSLFWCKAQSILIYMFRQNYKIKFIIFIFLKLNYCSVLKIKNEYAKLNNSLEIF